MRQKTLPDEQNPLQKIIKLFSKKQKGTLQIEASKIEEIHRDLVEIDKKMGIYSQMLKGVNSLDKGIATGILQYRIKRYQISQTSENSQGMKNLLDFYEWYSQSSTFRQDQSLWGSLKQLIKRQQQQKKDFIKMQETNQRHQQQIEMLVKKKSKHLQLIKQISNKMAVIKNDKISLMITIMELGQQHKNANKKHQQIWEQYFNRCSSNIGKQIKQLKSICQGFKDRISQIELQLKQQEAQKIQLKQTNKRYSEKILFMGEQLKKKNQQNR